MRSRILRFAPLAAIVTPSHAQIPIRKDIPASVIEFRDGGGLIVLAVSVNGAAPLSFVLDTGARPCVIDAAPAKRLGVVARESTLVKGGAGSVNAGVVSPVPRVTIAATGARISCAEMIVADLSSVSHVVGTPIAGLLGGDFFRGYAVTIDYRAHRITRVSSAVFRYRGRGDTVAIQIRRNRPWLTARLTVRDDLPADRELLIDSGSNDAVDDSLLLRSGDALSNGQGTGLGSGFQVKLGRFREVRIGRARYRDVPGVVPAVPIVGNGILRRYRRLTFDYDRGRLYLER